MKLFEHPDFQQAILAAAEHFRGQGLRPAIIEKDYYVTESSANHRPDRGRQDDFERRHKPVQRLEPDPKVLRRH